MQSHRQHARRRARTAQLAAGAGLAAALAIAVLPLHGALSRRAATNDTDRPETEGPAQRAAPDPLDQAWVSGIFRAVGPDALPEQVAAGTEQPTAPVDPDLPEGPDETEPTVVQDTRWQYLGSITTSRGRSALLRDKQAGNRQHLVLEGRQIEGFTVHQVDDAHVILTGGGRQTKVDLAPPSSTWASPNAPPPVRAAAAATANQQRANSRVNPALANRARAGRTRGEVDPDLTRQLREQVLHGEIDLDRVGAMHKAGMIDEATAAELVTQYKELQGLSEEEYAELREKLK